MQARSDQTSRGGKVVVRGWRGRLSNKEVAGLLLLALLSACGLTLMGSQVGSLSTEAVEVCDIPLPFSGHARIRGTGRLTDSGLLLADLTCPVTWGRKSIAKTVTVEVVRFVEAAKAEKFNEWLDSVERPVVQAVVSGLVECRHLEGVAPSRLKRPMGFGRTGRVACRVSNATVEKIIPFS